MDNQQDIARFLKHQMKEAEEASFRKRLSSDSDLRAEYEHYVLLHKTASQQLRQERRPDITAAFAKRIEEVAEQEDKTVGNNRSRKRLLTAGILLLILGSVAYLIWQNNTQEEPIVIPPQRISPVAQALSADNFITYHFDDYENSLGGTSTDAPLQRLLNALEAENYAEAESLIPQVSEQQQLIRAFILLKTERLEAAQTEFESLVGQFSDPYQRESIEWYLAYIAYQKSQDTTSLQAIIDKPNHAFNKAAQAALKMVDDRE